MKLPTLRIAAAFATGIGVSSAWTRPGLSAWLLLSSLTLLTGTILAWRKHLLPAWIASLAAWLALSGVAVCVERASVPANHVTRLIAAGRLDTGAPPLRCYGRLREDPHILP